LPNAVSLHRRPQVLESLSVRQISPLVGARDFTIAGDEPPLAENIVWTEQALPRVLRATKMLGLVSPSHQTMRPSGLSNASVWKQGEEVQALWSASASAHRLVVNARNGTPNVDAIVLPLDDAFEIRLDAARQFWRALNGRAPGPVYGTLPQQTKIRHILNLRAYDARRAGATYRRIAEVLLSSEPIAPRDWRDHHLRHKVRAILRRADRLIAGGYRDLLFYPHSRARRPDC
jgi:type VI secretion system activator RovC-like protein